MTQASIHPVRNLISNGVSLHPLVPKVVPSRFSRVRPYFDYFKFNTEPRRRAAAPIQPLFQFCISLCYTMPMNGKTFPHLTFTIQIFREGKLFVAYNPELDVSSCGSTLEKAKINIKDAIRGFLKSAAKMGTLQEILEEAGYVYRRTHWVDPELVSLDRMSVSA